MHLPNHPHRKKGGTVVQKTSPIPYRHQTNDYVENRGGEEVQYGRLPLCSLSFSSTQEHTSANGVWPFNFGFASWRFALDTLPFYLFPLAARILESCFCASLMFSFACSSLVLFTISIFSSFYLVLSVAVFIQLVHFLSFTYIDSLHP